jgi:hypothetical protein
MKRYQVVDGSASSHCCFDATVIDTHVMSPHGKPDWICECFDKQRANAIADAMNEEDAYPSPLAVTKYALRIVCKEAKAFDGTIMTPAGLVVWASESGGYWSGTEERNGKTPKDIYTFNTLEEAKTTRKKWKPMPWFYVPATIEVVAVKQTFKVVQDGWERDSG